MTQKGLSQFWTGTDATDDGDANDGCREEASASVSRQSNWYQAPQHVAWLHLGHTRRISVIQILLVGIQRNLLL